MIEIKNVSKVYETKEGTYQALKDLSLTINDGDIFGVIGSSGAGKSTLVRHINLLERPTSGQIVIDGVDVTNYEGKELRDLRTKIGMIFQNFSLFQQSTVLKNVLFPLEVRKAEKTEAKKKALELIKLVGLEGMENRYPSQLSGGQQQRVAIARALATDPEIMLCDEATSALDSKTTVQILDLLSDINMRLGVTMILITHSMEVAQHICNRIAVVNKGEIVEEGATEDIFANPQHPVTRELISHHQPGRN
ncbi:MAG: ATP-binding cassette domain-containing protein [Coriobacteriia bacterium]|nr:ATP-binding cassette domain-containing protein [Coriobacteriia bacterium]